MGRTRPRMKLQEVDNGGHIFPLRMGPFPFQKQGTIKSDDDDDDDNDNVDDDDDQSGDKANEYTQSHQNKALEIKD